MFSTILALIPLIATTLAVRSGKVIETQDLSKVRNQFACGNDQVLIGFTCKNNCKYMNLRCRALKNWGKSTIDSKMGVCDSRTGSHVLVGFDTQLNPKCRILSNNGDNKEFTRRCQHMTATFDSGVGINCPKGVITRVVVDKAAEKINVACCRDEDKVPPLKAKSNSKRASAW